MSARSSPARSSTRAVAGMGPVSMSTGSTPTTRHACTPGQRAPAQRARRDLAVVTSSARGAVGDLRGVARGDGAALLERRPQPGQHLQRRARPDALVLRSRSRRPRLGRAQSRTAPSAPSTTGTISSANAPDSRVQIRYKLVKFIEGTKHNKIYSFVLANYRAVAAKYTTISFPWF